MEVARTWLVKLLGDLARDVETKRVLTFSVSTPHEIIDVELEEGETHIRRAFTGVKGLHVTFTEHPLAVDRVPDFHDANVPPPVEPLFAPSIDPPLGGTP